MTGSAGSIHAHPPRRAPPQAAVAPGLPSPRPLADGDVARLEILRAGNVDLRRDLYQFVRYVQDKGLLRTRRGNQIPKSAARRLAKLLSYREEAEAVEEEGCGFWSDRISLLALQLGLVSFDTKGEYVGHSSTEPSFPDNGIQVQQKQWHAYLKKTALQKEKALLEAQVKNAPSEFFHEATLVRGEVFDGFGCAVGPASRMKLPDIRRALLEMLASLEANVWYELQSLEELLRASAPTLILDPSTREPDGESRRRLNAWEYQSRGSKRAKQPEVNLEDIYTNFREHGAGRHGWAPGAERQITSQTPDAFHRVEGRYLEFFLREIPYLCGFVDLAYRKPSDRHGLDIVPPLERLRAFRLTPRFFQIMRGDPELDRVKVTVLPTFEILVEAPSYPDIILDTLEPYTALVSEDGPMHRLRIERKNVVEAAAQDPGARPLVEVLEELTGSPLPQNVSTEIASWSERGEKLILYQGFGLLELRGSTEERAAVLRELGSLVEDHRPEGFAVVRNPDSVHRQLEKQLHVPVRIKHRTAAFVSCPGQLGATAPAKKPSRAAAQGRQARKLEVSLQSEDLIGYRASSAELLGALREALQAEARTCAIVGSDLLVVSAAALPALRAALRRLSDRYDVAVDAAARARPGES